MGATYQNGVTKMYAVQFYNGSKVIDWCGPFDTGPEAEAYADQQQNKIEQINGWTIERI